jgi:putative isomerase
MQHTDQKTIKFNKRNIMKKFSCLLIVIIAISSWAYAQDVGKAKKNSRTSFPNILDVEHSPLKPKEQTVSFSDMGAWHGITIPNNKVVGIGGPYLVADHVWAGSSLATLTIKGGKGEELTLGAAVKNTYYPGLINQQLTAQAITVNANIFFVSNRSSIIMVSITNTGNTTQTITPTWQGNSFAKAGPISASNSGVHIKTKTGRIELCYTNGVYRVLNTTDTTYAISQKPMKIKPGKSVILSATLTYLPHREQLSASERDLIQEALITPNNLLKQNEVRWDGYITSILHSDNNNWQTIAVKSLMTLVTNWKSALADIPYDGVIPSIAVNYFDGFWAWDSWKHAVALSAFNPNLAKDQIRAMFSYQDSSGMVIDCIYPDKAENNSRDSKPPLAAWAVWKTFKASNDTLFMKEMLPKLEKYHSWWYINRDHNKNGICEFGSCDGTLEAAGWESGMDNAIRFDSSAMVQNGPNAWSLNQESVDLNSFLFLEKLYLEKMCTIVKEGKQAAKYKSDANKLRDSIQKVFYDSKTTFFYDRVMDTDSLIAEQGSEGWHPLWVGAATKEQAEAVVKVLLDTTKFNTKVPFPTIAFDNKKFDPNGYWRGPVWLDQVYFAINGLRQYGYNKEADELTIKLFKNLGGINENAPIYENYQPASGKGIKAPNFSWSAAHLLMLYRELGQ